MIWFRLSFPSKTFRFEPLCVLSKIGVGNDITILKETTLKKCNDVYKARSSTKSKWSTITLPLSPNDVDGYHVQCYRIYTPVPKAIFDSIQEESLQDVNETPNGTCETSTSSGKYVYSI